MPRRAGGELKQRGGRSETGGTSGGITRGAVGMIDTYEFNIQCVCVCVVYRVCDPLAIQTNQMGERGQDRIVRGGEPGPRGQRATLRFSPPATKPHVILNAGSRRATSCYRMVKSETTDKLLSHKTQIHNNSKIVRKYTNNGDELLNVAFCPILKCNG